MKTTGLPVTTVERDGALSHFAVHISPIYYLMLPFYCLIPRPETLQILQAAVLASAVIPLWMLGRHHGLHPCLRAAVCVLLLVYPSYAGGASYDIHENCFLTPLILWLFYGIDRKKISITALSAALTLMVKEDAPVYVAVVGLYLLLRSALQKDKWGRRVGAALTAGAIFWFLCATAYLSGKGDGVMTGRYQNFMYDGSGSLRSVVKAILLCPMKAVFECVDAEKQVFLALTVLPLLGLPLMTRRYERYLLLIPYLLVNLMSDYQYQHNIMYQYTFGSAACLFYLTVVNLADIKTSWKQTALLAAALSIGAVCFFGKVFPVAKRQIVNCARYEAYYDSQRELLDTIPEDASVAATTFYTVYLSRRSELYDVRYGARAHILGCDYVVIKTGETKTFQAYETGEKSGKEAFTQMLLENGFQQERVLPEVLEIYRKSGN